MELNRRVQMKFEPKHGDIVKEDERYVVRDFPFGHNLTISSTRLYPGQETGGHSHEGQEEVYFFVSGSGKMTLSTDVKSDVFEVTNGDVVPIEDGVFHKVFNDSEDDLYFVCVFNGKRSS